MKKYVSPRIEVAQIRMASMVLTGSPTVTPLPPGPGTTPTPGRKLF